VETQLPAFELAWLAMEKVNECHLARRDRFLRVIAVRAEKVPVIAGCDLSFHVSDGELFDPELIQHSGQHAPNSLQNDFLMPSHIHEHLRTPMAGIDDTRVSAGRNYRTALELCLMLQGVAHEFVEFLRSQELVEDDALRPNRRRPVQHTDVAPRFEVAWLCPPLHRRAYRLTSAWRLRRV
jgi:hypothetical protein